VLEAALAIVGIVLGLVILGVGYAGCILPVLPGPTVAFLSLLCLQLTGVHAYGWVTLVALGGAAVLILILDNLVPIWGVRRVGGSRWGILGGAVGVVVGLFVFPPIGVILGPAVGAILGEVISGNTGGKALASGAGTLLGFLVGALAKTVLTSVIAGFFAYGILCGLMGW